MTPKFRRIVTGEDGAGSSFVLSDSVAPFVDVRSIHWFTERSADALRDIAPTVVGATPMAPRPGATTFQIVVIPADEASLSHDELDAFYRSAFVGTTITRGDTNRHPGMHRTATIDYVVVLEGEPTLILSQEEVTLRPFETVVQRGTEHGWTNRCDRPAILAIVTIDLAVAGTTPLAGRHALELAALHGLTPSESAVAMALAAGTRLADIAAERHVSINTVRTHLARLRSKLGVSSQAEIVRAVLLAVGSVTHSGDEMARPASAGRRD